MISTRGWVRNSSRASRARSMPPSRHSPARALPVGLELMGRPQADEVLVAMMGAFEVARGPLPPARRAPGRADLATLGIARQNELRLRLGWSAFHSRHGKDIGALEPARFR